MKILSFLVAFLFVQKSKTEQLHLNKVDQNALYVLSNITQTFEARKTGFYDVAIYNFNKKIDNSFLDESLKLTSNCPKTFSKNVKEPISTKYSIMVVYMHLLDRVNILPKKKPQKVFIFVLFFAGPSGTPSPATSRQSKVYQ
jgi:hypothetical protein